MEIERNSPKYGLIMRFEIIYFERKRLIYTRWLYAFLVQEKSSFLGLVQSCQFIWIFPERALRKTGSGAAPIAPSERPLKKHNDQEARVGCRVVESWESKQK